MKRKNEYNPFSELAGKLFKVPHSDIKKKLDAEKEAKKRRKLKVSGASREAI
jgi:hypothetical protein